MKTRDIPKRKTRLQKQENIIQARGSYAAYGDKTPICVNAGCVMRKQATCFGFEGCPGFKAKG